MEAASLSISELQSQFRSGALSPVDVVQALEQRIAQVDPKVQGYLSRDFNAALEMAKHADVSLPLGGVPIAIKDVINVLGEPCTCGSQILVNYRAPYDATVIKKLRAGGGDPVRAHEHG